MRLSVVMATYNGGRYIEAQLDSILPQISDDDEVIVSDDASSDGTVEIIEKRRDKRIRILVNARRIGYIKNFQHGIESSRGEHIFFADQDDVWLPDKVARMSLLLRTHGCVVSDAIVVDEELRELHTSFFAMRKVTRFTFAAVFTRPCFIGATMACRADYIRSVMPFPANIPHDFWLSLNAIWDSELEVVRDPLLLYRRHSATASVTATQRRRRVLTIASERLALAAQFSWARLVRARRSFLGR